MPSEDLAWVPQSPTQFATEVCSVTQLQLLSSQSTFPHATHYPLPSPPATLSILDNSVDHFVLALIDTPPTARPPDLDHLAPTICSPACIPTFQIFLRTSTRFKSVSVICDQQGWVRHSRSRSSTRYALRATSIHPDDIFTCYHAKSATMKHIHRNREAQH